MPEIVLSLVSSPLARESLLGVHCSISRLEASVRRLAASCFERLGAGNQQVSVLMVFDSIPSQH
jgi:hypothetical protein